MSKRMNSTPGAATWTSSRLCLAAMATLLLLQSNCAQYRVGGSKPAHLESLHSLEVALVQNDTQLPRASAYATNSLIDAITRDGTYRITKPEHADARLLTTLQRVTYRQARSTRLDVLRSEELEMEVHLVWTLVEIDNPTKVLARGKSIGETRFFLDANTQAARQTALIDALNRASEAVVTRLADGF